MTTNEISQKIRESVDAAYLKAIHSKHSVTTTKKPRVSFVDFNGSTLGRYRSSEHVLEFDLAVASRNVDQYCGEVVPHEMAHAMVGPDRTARGLWMWHGKKFKAFMRDVYGLQGKSYTNFKAKDKKAVIPKNKHLGKCEHCGSEFFLSTYKVNRLSKYRCRCEDGTLGKILLVK